jgi:hypothetical protein
MKYATERLFADPEKAARRLMEHAQAFEPIQDGRIYIEEINDPFLFGDKGTPAEYSAGLELAISRGWLEMHESGNTWNSRHPAPICSPDRWQGLATHVRGPDTAAEGSPACHA